jgi:hypothetical protein
VGICAMNGPTPVRLQEAAEARRGMRGCSPSDLASGDRRPPAAATDGRRVRSAPPRECLRDRTNTASAVWADTAYRSNRTENSWPRTASTAVCNRHGQSASGAH